MSSEVLQILAYLVVGVVITGYIMLDGFDLGVGILQMFARQDRERRIFLNAIGPVWDGNEVWLVIIAGGLFAAFSDVYSAIFSGFYNIIMILLAGIIFRSIAIEFRSKVKHASWRNLWDLFFFLSSLTIAFFIGLMLGNLVVGVPIDASRNYHGTFESLWHIYPIFVGVFGVALFAQHGLLYLLMKTEGDLQVYLRKLYPYFYTLFFGLYIAMSIWTWVEVPHMLHWMNTYIWLYLVPLVNVLTFILLAFIAYRGSYGWAFVTSALSIALLFLTYGIGTFPNMVISSLGPDLNLTLFNSSSSDTTLRIFLLIVVIGVPLVLAYTSMIYHIFRGKVKLHDASY